MPPDLSSFKLVIFVKAARLGNVKTRLAAGLGHQAALAAYKQIAETLLENLRGLSDVQIRFSPDDAEAELREWLGCDFEFQPQGAGDLGQRLQRAFAENFSAGFRRVVVIGSDCPELTRGDIELSANVLLKSDAVLGPATDGGYWLIGLRAVEPSLFTNIPWSTERVLDATLAGMRSANLQYRLLRELSDIDTEADWRRYSSVLRAAEHL